MKEKNKTKQQKKWYPQYDTVFSYAKLLFNEKQSPNIFLCKPKMLFSRNLINRDL